MDEGVKSTGSEVIENDWEMENLSGGEVVQRNEMDVEAGAGGEVLVPVSRRSRQNSVEVSDHLPMENCQNYEELDVYEEQLDQLEEFYSEFENSNDSNSSQMMVILGVDAEKALETLVNDEQSDFDLNQPPTSRASSPPQQDPLPVVEVESGTIMSTSSSNRLVEGIAEATANFQGPVTAGRPRRRRGSAKHFKTKPATSF